ncbi:MAG: hypothetical protein GY803_09435, partial [Chloroflexi bacterium]|nr:hypothetical protein [Chloroflexota bacterium]
MISASQKPVITHVLVIPDLDLSRRKDQSQDQIFPQKIVSVGLVLDGERVAWGNCVADGRDAIGHPPRFAAVDGAISIQESVVPALQGQSLSSFRELAAIVESLTEQVTITQSLPQPEPGASVKKISRRDLFTGRLWSPEPKPRTKQVIIERPLHPAIRFGVSQALLKAAAMTRNLTIAELIADEYGLSLPPSPVPIHLETSGDKDAINQALHLQVASVGYRLPGKEPIEELGNNGVILQQ